MFPEPPGMCPFPMLVAAQHMHFSDMPICQILVYRVVVVGSVVHRARRP
jgi:hypothetical protein